MDSLPSPLTPLYFLAAAGINIDDAIAKAQQKDSGVEPATLGWVLGQVKVRQTPTNLLKPLTTTALQGFIDELAARLARRSFPAP